MTKRDILIIKTVNEYVEKGSTKANAFLDLGAELKLSVSSIRNRWYGTLSKIQLEDSIVTKNSEPIQSKRKKTVGHKIVNKVDHLDEKLDILKLEMQTQIEQSFLKMSIDYKKSQDENKALLHKLIGLFNKQDVAETNKLSVSKYGEVKTIETKQALSYNEDAINEMIDENETLRSDFEEKETELSDLQIKLEEKEGIISNLQGVIEEYKNKGFFQRVFSGREGGLV